jgi:hypothetical protein
MMGGNDLAIKLLQLGITIDHSDAHEGTIIAEISESELAIVKQNNISHEVLITDLADYYEKRNKADIAGKTMMPPVCNAPTIVKPTYFHLGSMGGFFTYNEMKQILDSMALLYPNLITVKTALSPLSIENRELWMVKISDNPNVDEAEPEVLYNSLHHAREAASLSQLIFYMWYILENYATNPDIQATVNSTEMYFVPCVNPDGYVYNQTTNPNGGGMWRKNRRNNGSTFGVDLNRNYGYFWGYDNVGSSNNPSSDTYRGTAGFSEPETQAMRNFCNARTFVTALNAHTYSNLLIYPWGYLPSFYTPDSATFVNWGVHLTEDSRFLYGTGDQTVAYVTNGDSDDWMYGEQGTKPKILSMTPEAGSASDGFWPAQSRIIDICKTTFNQNYYLAKVAAKYAIARDEHDRYLPAGGYLKYSVQRLGLGGATFTVNITPVGGDISSVGPAKTYSLAQNQLVKDSISFTLNTGLSPAQVVKYILSVDNGTYVKNDTISKIYGTPITLVYNNGNATATNFTTSGTWGVSTSKFVSPPSSITESPAGNYSSNANKSITLNAAANLNSALYASLQYYTRFETEKNYDFAKVFYSINNGATWNPLCTKYQTSPASSGNTNPEYDGLQDGWVKEDVDISAYIGQNFLVRFTFTSDGFENKDGFYFDDLWIRKISSVPVGVKSNIMFDENIIVSPNPSNGLFNLTNPDQKEISVEVVNSLGQVVYKEAKAGGTNSSIDLRGKASGIYFMKLRFEGNEVVKKMIVE